MRTSILAALMAATALIPGALIPGAAMAQRGERDGNSGWQQRGGDRPQREQRGDRGDRQRPQPQQAQPQQAQPQPQQSQPQVRPVRQDGGNDGPRFDRGDRRGNGGPRFDRGGQGGYRPTPPVASTPVAQPNRPNDRNDWRGNDNRGGNNQWRGNDNRGGNNQWRGNDNRGGNNQWRGNDNRGGNNQWRGNDNRGGQWRGNDGRGNDRGNWNRKWRQDNRYDWNRRRQYNRNAYHLPRYYAPSGWGQGYRRFNVGFTLSSILFSQNYWIGDASYYGLPEAYGEYRWVRYYNDALLVDTYSGEVVDTVYDIFW